MREFEPSRHRCLRWRVFKRQSSGPVCEVEVQLGCVSLSVRDNTAAETPIAVPHGGYLPSGDAALSFLECDTHPTIVEPNEELTIVARRRNDELTAG